MIFNNLKSKAKVVATKTAMKLKDHGPDMGTYGGIIGATAGLILVGIACTKVKPVLDKHNEKITEVRRKVENATEENPVDKKEIRKETFDIYKDTAVDIGKLLGPGTCVFALSMVSIAKSHKSLKADNTNLKALAAESMMAFKNYRQNARDRFGEEVDRELMAGSKKETLVEETVDENGKKKKVKEKVEVVDPNSESIYLRYFTRENRNWDKNEDILMYFFDSVQALICDNMLQYGSEDLNEAYKQLGFPVCSAGMRCGWIYDKHNPTGDNKAIFDVRKVYIRNDQGLLEKAYAIDFNVDGDIYTIMKKREEANKR